MNFEEYKKAYYVDPPPEPKFRFAGLHSFALYFERYAEAVAFYQEVLGPPAYVEGEFTHGWRLGNIWLTVFPAKSGAPRNAEMAIQLDTPQEAERLHQAFIDAGGEGEPPSDEIMYEPIRFCYVKDKFGTPFIFLSPLPGA